MGRIKIALLHCEQPHEGPWLRPQGGETGVNVFPTLATGEEVWIDMEYNSTAEFTRPSTSTPVETGFTSLLLANAHRYRVRKVGSGTPTNVEVIFNGKARS